MNDKERVEKLKVLRRELEEKLEEQLPSPEPPRPSSVEVQKITGSEELDPQQAKRVIEALLFAAARPLTLSEIRKVLKNLTMVEIAKIIRELQGEIGQSGRSFELIDVANGYEFATKKEYAPWIMKMELQKKAKQVTQSALETLAILAYKQPITRAEIEELRGVDVSGVITTLMERDLIKIVGKKEVPGRPFLYGTTEKFLEHFGLKSMAELPNIEEIRTLVQNSVNKEDLLGMSHEIEAAPPEGPESGSEASAPPITGNSETPSSEISVPGDIDPANQDTAEPENIEGSVKENP